MKTSMIILGTLTIMTVVYGTNPELVQKFKDNMAKCCEILNVPSTEPTPDTLYCTFIRLGGIFNSDGSYNKEATMNLIEDVIPEAVMKQAKANFTICYDKGQRHEGTIREKMEVTLECAFPITYYV